MGVISAVGIRTLLILLLWALFTPALWVYSRFFPRIPDRVLFWTNEGFRVAPSRVRSYGFSHEMAKLGVDTQVLSFWDHICGYRGLPPFIIPLHERTVLMFKAMMAAIRSRAGILVAQRPFYEFLPLAALKAMYPRSLRIWADVDDWIFDYSLGGRIDFRDTLPIHSLISEGCVVSSLPLLQEMQRYYRRVEIIPTYPDATVFIPRNNSVGSDDTVVFSWSGTLFSKENSDDVLFLVEVLESLKDPRVTFHIVGAGTYLEELRRETRKIASHAEVMFLGWREPETMPQYYAGIDVGLYCLTVQNDFCRSKSPTKLFEYMACGKPSVSTDYGEAPRFVDHGVTGFVASNFNEFARCCAALIDDPDLRVTMGRNARKRIEEQYNIAGGLRTLKKILMDRSE